MDITLELTMLINKVHSVVSQKLHLSAIGHIFLKEPFRYFAEP
jgi:hypothetical protein